MNEERGDELTLPAPVSPVAMPVSRIRWPQEGITRVPLRVFADAATYEEEQTSVFRGPTWSFLCHEVEIPNPGDYVTTKIGETSVIVVRLADGGISALVNRRSTFSSDIQEGVYVRIDNDEEVLYRAKLRRATFVAGREDFNRVVTNKLRQ